VALRRPRFLFLVHALSPAHRRVIGLRRAEMGLLFGLRDGLDPWRGIGRLARLRLDDPALPGGGIDGEVIGLPLDPEQMLADQELALTRMERAVRLALRDGPVDAVGLGSLCAVVAGRGTALAERLDVPVTTGGAATAWALIENAERVVRLREDPGPVAIVGSSGPVGQAVAAGLVARGLRVRVDSKRGGRGAGVEAADGPAAAVAGAGVVVGAGPTGGVLDPAALAPGAVLIDVALPDTLTGPAPAGARVLAGEALAVPRTWHPGGWGRLYHIFANYGPGLVFACLVEPLAMAAAGRRSPLAIGRRVDAEAVAELGRVAGGLGFRPVLARGWRPQSDAALRR
jgi:predicted amino acid dehydrogenase